MVANEKDIGQVSAELQESISRLDVGAVGIASLDEWKGTRLEETALKILPSARSVIVMAMEIYQEILTHVSPERITGAASMNDLYAQHGEYISSRLTRAAYDVAKESHALGFKALPLPSAGCPYDLRFMEAIFSFKHAGQAAGLGYIGKSSLLITPEFGSRGLISCCLTEAVLEPKKIQVVDKCQNCDICIVNCPAGALSRPEAGASYAIDKFACSAFRSASGGCSECMRLCPTGVNN